MKYVVTLLLLVLLAVACTYELEGEFHKDIDTSAPPTISVALNDLQPGSTIVITQNTNFTFKYSIDPGIVKTVNTYLDDNLLFSGYGFIADLQITTTFNLGPGNASPGIHTLKVVVTSTSGTGSLADAAGDEIRTVEKTWIINSITGVPAAPVLSFSNANGYLKVSWTPYTRPNFGSYSLLMERDPFNRDGRMFTDSLTTSFIDSSYVGGYNKTYTLTINTVSFGSVSGSAVIEDNLVLTPELRLSDTTYLLTWNKADYAGVFDSYSLGSSTNVSYTSSNINDTTFRLDPDEFIFGQPIGASVLIKCKDRNPPSFSPLVFAQTDAYLPGTKKFNATFVTYNNTVDKVYGIPVDQYNIPINGGVLQEYSADLEDPGDTMDQRTSIPFSGTTGYAPVDGFGVRAFDLQTKAVVDELDLTTMTNDGHIYGVNRIIGSSTGVVLVYYLAKDDFLQIRQYALIYDMVNNKVLSAPSPTLAGNLSGNGKYFMTGSNLYINNGSYFDTGWALPNTSCFFRADNPEEMICPAPGSWAIRKSSDGSLLRSISIPASTYYNGAYDPVRHVLMFFVNDDETTYKCVDVETGEVRTIRGVSGNFMVNGYFVNGSHYFYKAIN